MQAIYLHDREEIEAYLRHNTALHIYELGDLDDFFWPYTTWYATQDQRQQIDQLALFYIGGPLPVLLGLTEEPAKMRTLLQSILHMLPARLYLHLTDGVIPALQEHYSVQSDGLHYKMELRDKTRLATVDTSHVVQLTTADMSEIEALYSVSYPENWFDVRMLETGCYFGIRHGQTLVSIAGIHVYSSRYRVAALGNVTTHPNFRGRGLGKQVCAKLCQHLLQTVDHIGLNVKADNAIAIACYEHLGFAHIGTYEEFTCTLK